MKMDLEPMVYGENGNDELLTVREIAELEGVDQRTVYRWIRSFEVPSQGTKVSNGKDGRLYSRTFLTSQRQKGSMVKQVEQLDEELQRLLGLGIAIDNLNDEQKIVIEQMYADNKKLQLQVDESQKALVVAEKAKEQERNWRMRAEDQMYEASVIAHDASNQLENALKRIPKRDLTIYECEWLQEMKVKRANASKIDFAHIGLLSKGNFSQNGG